MPISLVKIFFDLITERGYIMSILLYALVLGIIPASIAHSKGRNFVLWYIYGVALFIIALVHSLLISKSPEAEAADFRDKGYVECPYCKEYIKPDATVCPHCERDISK